MRSHVPFPELRTIPALFEGEEQFSFSGLSSGATCRVTPTGDLALHFQYDEKMVADCKLFRRSHWDPTDRCWRLEVCTEQCGMLVDFLKRAGFTFSRDVLDLLRARW